MIEKHRHEVVILAAAVCLRLILAVIFYGHSGWDYDRLVDNIKNDGYYEIAVNLATNHVFQVSPELGPTTLRSPGYPFLLALFLYVFGNVWFFLALQIIIASWLPLLGRKLCLEITGNKRPAGIVAWFMVIEPVGVFLSFRLLSETFFTFFFLLAFIQLVKFLKYDQSRFRRAVSAAIGFGLATNIRPTTIYLPLILALLWCAYYFWHRRFAVVKTAAVFLSIFILILTPWFYRNYTVFGKIGFTSIQHQGLYMFLAPSVLAVKNHEDFSQSSKKFFQAEGFNDSLPINIDRGDWFARRAKQVIVRYPRELAVVSGTVAATFFTHDGVLDLLRGFGLVPTVDKPMTVAALWRMPLSQIAAFALAILASPYIFILIMRIIWFLITIGLVASVIFTIIKKNFNVMTVLTLVCIFYFALSSVTIGFAINARFRFPVNALILTLAVSFVYTLLRNKVKKGHLSSA